MMERRILKDFQIGIVETIVSEAVRGTSEVRDVFSTIAKAMNKRGPTKKLGVHRSDVMAQRFDDFLFWFEQTGKKIGMLWSVKILWHEIQLVQHGIQ